MGAYNPQSDTTRIRAAYHYALQAHEGQYRRSGEPYIVHPVAVASLLAEQKLDDATIITALLHDTVEDTGATHDDLARKFGPEIAELVDGVTKLTSFQINNTETRQAENFRKLFIAMSRDLRVILVKLFDRLHNMRTLRSLPLEKQQKKARETMEIYAPLAGRLGMQWMREELEDLAFVVLNPDARLSILRRAARLSLTAEDEVERLRYAIDQEMREEGIPTHVLGRLKRPYSIWRKMGENDSDESFARVSDIYGFRIITGTRMDCYHALGAIHRRWKAVPGRFKDYISQPKVNGYRSLHTTVFGRDGKRIEVQIRTREMHEVAETGVAAHWAYRDGERIENPYSVDPALWVDSMAEYFEAGTDVKDFFEAVKLEMYADKVFCFTPKGEVIKLPKGATPLDFAFAIHTRIGLGCVGAKVDGSRVPLWTALRNGQQVEIITAEGQSPQATWMDIALTGKAKSAIRKALREERRARFVKLGRELARGAFASIGRTASDKVLETAARKLGHVDKEELLARLGSGEITARTVTQAVYPELQDTGGAEIDVARAVLGLDPNQNWNRGTCCRPVPGERIVGITTPGTGVIVHTIDCRRLAEYEDQMDRWVDLHWQPGRHSAAFSVQLALTMSNDAGVLGRVCTLIGEQRANISDMELLDRKPDFYRIMLEIEVRDVEHLLRVTTALEADTNVAEVARRRYPDGAD